MCNIFRFYGPKGVIVPPKYKKKRKRKGFGIATCQSDDIVLTATPVSDRNMNCF